MNKNRICFVLDTHYPNYTNRLKTTSLKDYIDNNLQDLGIGFIITTNRPQDFTEYLENGVMIYDVNELRKENTVSLEFEILHEDPTGIYPSKFPWNLERFGLRKASELGYNIVVNLDSDVVFNSKHDITNFVEFINSIYEENTVVTNQAIFNYEKNSQNEIFYLHDHYIKHFNLEYKDYEYNSLDGPVIIYMGKTPDDIMRYYNNWNFLTEFGYKREFGFGYGNIVCGNWSLCIPISGYKLRWVSLPFTPHHKYEDRY